MLGSIATEKNLNLAHHYADEAELPPYILPRFLEEARFMRYSDLIPIDNELLTWIHDEMIITGLDNFLDPSKGAKN